MLPATAMILAATIAAAAQGGSTAFGAGQQKKASRLRSKELKRETYANLLNDAMQRSAELEGQGLQSNSRLGQRKSQGINDTASLLRGAFNL